MASKFKIGDIVTLTETGKCRHGFEKNDKCKIINVDSSSYPFKIQKEDGTTGYAEEYQIEKVEEGNQMNNKILKISSKSNPNSVAGAIVGILKENKKVELQAIGAGAVNQAVKAIAVARGFVAPSGVDLIYVPAFAEVNVENENRTGLKFIIREEK